MRTICKRKKTGPGRFKSRRQPATKQDLREMEKRIMSKISEFADRQNAFNAKQEAAIEDLTGDVKFLTDKIVELQNSPGAITPEDQATLDALEVRAAAATAKLEALAAQTPPTPPA